jgi:AraC-like DNA-binding protein
MSEPRPIEHLERAHLRDERGFSPPVHRLVPSPDLADLVRRYWLPVWSLPEGEVTVQRVLQYPVCLLVVTSDYATLVGPTSELSTRELTGSGWAVGVLLQPAAGTLVSGRSVDQLADQVLPITEAAGLDGARLTDDVRRVVGDAAADPDVRMQAVLVMEEALRTLPPVDEEGLLVNAIVEYVEGDTEVQRVSQVCEKFAISERSLQRLTARRIGLGPKWLIQRRRLHEVAERLRGPEPPDLARVAADLGYSDQAHLTRDFRRVTGLTPGEFAGEPRG